MAHGGHEGIGQVCAGIPGISKLLPAVPEWCVLGFFFSLLTRIKGRPEMGSRRQLQPPCCVITRLTYDYKDKIVASMAIAVTLTTRCPATVPVKQLVDNIVLIDVLPGCRVEIAGAVRFRAKEDIRSYVQQTWQPDNITRPALNLSWPLVDTHIALNPLHIVPRAQIDQLRKLVWKPSTGEKTTMVWLPGAHGTCIPWLGLFGFILAVLNTLYLAGTALGKAWLAGRVRLMLVPDHGKQSPTPEAPTVLTLAPGTSSSK